MDSALELWRVILTEQVNWVIIIDSVGRIGLLKGADKSRSYTSIAHVTAFSFSGLEGGNLFRGKVKKSVQLIKVDSASIQ